MSCPQLTVPIVTTHRLQPGCPYLEQGQPIEQAKRTCWLLEVGLDMLHQRVVEGAPWPRAREN